VRRSTGPLGSLRCLRRVWVPMPVPPYTVTVHPSSSGTALVSRVIIPRPSGASGVHEGPMVPVLKTYQFLEGPDRISSQGETSSSPCHDSTSIGISCEGCPDRTPPARLAPKTHRRILSDRLNPHHPPKTHAKISPVLFIRFTKFLALRALYIYASHSPASHHIYNASKSKSSSM
jgi:hypothetical protein